jgi:D-alanyl-D-alanine carboxypeptidase (penicillin-binding protein 5/6)
MRALPVALAACVVGLALAVNAAAAPLPAAPAWILVERDTGAVVGSANANEERPIASTTKLMTAYVTLEHEPLTRILAVVPYAPSTAGESLAGLAAGERLSVADLLEAMLLPSGNDVAHTLAIDVGGSVGNFVAMMNAAARRLGLTRTHYSTPIGLDTPGDNYSTVANLATLAGVLMRNAFFARTVARHSATLSDGRVMTNTNDLVGRYPFAVGIKTGHTDDAGYCLVGGGARDGVNLISVVLGDPSEAARDADTLALLRYGLSLFSRVTVVHRARVYARLALGGQPGVRIALVAPGSISVVVRRGGELDVYLTGVPGQVGAPPPAGTAEGQIDVAVDGRRVDARAPACSADRIRLRRRRVLRCDGRCPGL